VCGICDIDNKIKEVDVFTDDDFDRIIQGILFGLITTSALDQTTYLKTVKELMKGVVEGYGKEFSDLPLDSTDYRMLQDLQDNVYIFSGAKTYQQTRELSETLSSFLVQKDGITSLSEFQKQAKDILVNYNRNYLTTEYNSAISQARSASQWEQVTKDKALYPNLVYHTVGDSRVRFSHAVLDGTNKPVNDKFWDKNFPPNDWNCRCTVLQSDDTESTNMQGYKVDDHVNPVFQFNAGKDRIVFSPEHPYFTVAPKDKSNAVNNWGLPTP
jgi:SPP1 gp7 family putative phage head morphogenesis protein